MHKPMKPMKPMPGARVGRAEPIPGRRTAPMQPMKTMQPNSSVRRPLRRQGSQNLKINRFPEMVERLPNGAKMSSNHAETDSEEIPK